MPRPPRSITANCPVHIMQRGINRRSSFRCEQDFRSYLAALRETSAHYRVSIYAFVLMTNHVHILAVPAREDAVSRMMQQLGRKYVCYFNKLHVRTGTLWEGRFRSSVIGSEHYLFACYRYIELNPVRAGLARSAREYKWSSYRANAMNLPDGLVTASPEWLALGQSSEERARRYRHLFVSGIEDHDERIRVALRKGRSLV
ncbi:MAG: transposase [Gammaproteobacteria bacterium]|nr:transposase [Gammaproteobacteria bacterium]